MSRTPARPRLDPQELKRQRIERLKPYRWPKGFSGNPGGSRNLSLRAAIREQYGNDAEELRRALHDFRLHAKNEQVRLKALELELGYHSGAVSQQIELSGQTVGARTVQIVLQPSSGVAQPLVPADAPLALPPAEPSTA